MNEQNKTRRRTSKKKRWSAKRKIIISTIAVFALIIGILAYGYLSKKYIEFRCDSCKESKKSRFFLQK